MLGRPSASVQLDGCQRIAKSSANGTRLAFVGAGTVTMLTCNKLLVDPCDGSPVVDYRIEDGHVESRIWGATAGIATEKHWQILTPEQLSSHVMSNTVVARWLLGRLGAHRLVRACSSSESNRAQESSQQGGRLIF